ncbi:hypothetical protein [Nonomuraea endophytica]|uniref:hypothetical protein n=1 Tax=Nonomuraea endophytica TaxID=714136 RepID=UPI0037C99B6C
MYRLGVAALLLPLLVATPAAAAVPDQGRPSMGASRTGWSAVAFEHHPTPGQAAGTEIYVRQFRDGAQIRETKVSAGGTGAFSHTQPSVGVSDSGDAVVTWAQDGDGDGARDIVLRVLRADGTMSATVVANGPGELRGDQVWPQIAVRGSGSFAVTWEDHPDAATSTVRLAAYSAITSRTFGPVQVSAAGTAANPAVAVHDTGAILAWEQNTDILYAKVAANGTIARANTPANADATNSQLAPSVAAMAGGDFVIVWAGNPDGAWRVRVRGFRADLTQRFPQRVATPGTANRQANPKVGIDDTGGFALAWNEDVNGIDVHAAGFNSDATPQRRFPPTRINLETGGLQGAAAIGVLPDATFGVAHEEDVTLSGSRRVVTRLGLRNLTDPGATITTPLEPVPGAPLTMTYDAADLAKVRQAEQAHAQLAPQPVSAVLASANSTARPLCHPTNSTPPAQGFCWDDTYGDDSAMTFVPQGLTTDGSSLLLAGWYNYDHPDFARGLLTRLTFADISDPANVRYRHALLVRPTGTSQVFEPVGGHADAVVLIGNLLYLRTFEPAPTGTNGYEGFDVFDLRHIWKMNGSGRTVGLSSGAFNASYHLWALPRVATYHFPTQGCGTYQPDKPVPCITAAAYDPAAGELVTFEAGQSSGPAQFTTSTGDIVRWPVDQATGLLTGTASARLRTRIPGLQGGTSHDGRYVLAGPCPEWVGGMYNIPSCVYTAGTGEPTKLWTRGGTNLENLAYQPASDRLWMLNEAPRKRVVYHHPWPR